MPRPPNPKLPEMLMTAALEMLDEREDATFSMRELSGRIGYAVTAIYRCYETRGHLLRQLTLRLFDELDTELSAVTGETVQGRLLDFGHRFVAWAVRYPGRYRLMFEHNDPEAMLIEEERDALETPVRRLRSILDDAIKAGELDPALDSESLAAILFASMHGLIALCNTKRLNGVTGADPESFFDRTGAAWIGGLLAA